MGTSLIDALAATSRGQRQQCAVCRVVDDLDASDQTELLGALEDVTITGAHIARALQHLGYAVKPASVQRHRREGCMS